MKRLPPFPGFTLIELIVSVGLFAVVMLIAIAALAGMANADRKAQSIEAVVDNLDFALDDMSRIIRTGTTYHCTDGGGDTLGSMGDPTVRQDCSTNGSSYIALEGSHGSRTNPSDQIVYWFNPSCTGFPGGCIEKSTDSGQTFLPLTSPDIMVDSGRFYVTGSGAWPADTLQPKVVAVMTARVKLSSGNITTLNLQTTLTQRVYDE